MSDLKRKLAEHKKQKAASRSESDGANADIVALMGADGTQSDISVLSSEAKNEGRFVSLPARCFYPDPTQPRKTFDSDLLLDLQRGIESTGQLQPIVIKPADGDGRHMIIAGERRWRAISASSEINAIDALIVDSDLDVVKVLRMQIQENENRENVNALETAQAVMRGVDLCKSHDSSINDTKAAKILGVTSSAISKSRSILNAPESIKALSDDDVTQDTEALYEITKAHKKNPDKTEAFIESVKSNKDNQNIRKAAKSFGNELKNKPEGDAEKKGDTVKNEDISIPDKKKQLKMVDNVIFDEDEDGVLCTFNIGNKTEMFLLSSAAVSAITAFE